ncbi:MAG: DUF7577 domain-containing protein [Halobacteriota archaeon]
MTQMWVYALVAIAIGHLLATVGVYYWLGRGAERTDEGDGIASSRTHRETSDPEPTQEHGDDVVVCPNCNTTNEPGYRYCRQCVSPIDVGGRPRGTADGPDLPFTR